MAAVYLESLADISLLGSQVIEPVNKFIREKNETITDATVELLVSASVIDIFTDFNDALDGLMAGQALLVLPNEGKIFGISLPGYPRRPIEESITEKNVVPGTLLPPVIGTQQQFEKRNYIITAEDNSITDAWSKLQAKSERDIYFGQLRAIVLTENAARGDINNLLDFIGRIPYVPPNTTLLVTKADPKELLDMKNESNNIPGNYVDLFFQTQSKKTLAIPIDLWRVLAQMDNKTSDPHIPMIKASEGSYDLSGTALFSDNHFVGELDLEETKTLALIQGSSTGYLTVPLENGDYVAFKDVTSKNDITLELDNKVK